MLLRDRTMTVLRASTEIEDPRQWLSDAGFATSAAQHFRQIALMLAPLMAALIGDFVGRLAG